MMTKRIFKKMICMFAAAICGFAALTGCAEKTAVMDTEAAFSESESSESAEGNSELFIAETSPAEKESADLPAITTALQINNLQKLCKVWGYVKYSHPVFIYGKKDWDQELLKLMPDAVMADTDEKMNAILYEWFIELGEITFEPHDTVHKWVEAKEEDKIVQADTGWISDEAYLGKPLSDALMQIRVALISQRAGAPVYFDGVGRSDFSNEKSYENMDYSDDRYRLLGLFRFWNAIEYYYPYLDILDDDWTEQLPVFIPKMLEGTDQLSYERTMTELFTKLHDVHVGFLNNTSLLEEFGKYAVPVKLTKAEGKLVVLEVLDDGCKLLPGDVLAKVNGAGIDEVIKKIKKYCTVNTDDKLLNSVAFFVLRSHNKQMEITVLRDGSEQTISVEGTEDGFNMMPAGNSSHEVLEHNIGLINPSMLKQGELDDIMKEFSDTDGLIVDLRQYPKTGVSFELDKYLLNKDELACIFTLPSIAVPGTFLKVDDVVKYDANSSIYYYYDKKVVLLMNEQSQSSAEYRIMRSRRGENVIVMGENSVGSDGNVTYLPMPDGNTVIFTGLGVYTPEGGQTQRIGLSPDIYIDRTIAGVREGRDEYIEAAVQYIIDQNHKK